MPCGAWENALNPALQPRTPWLDWCLARFYPGPQGDLKGDFPPMKQAIAGVTPYESQEVTSMHVWPSVASFGLGRFLGRLYSINLGVGVVKVGNLIALATAPIGALLYFFRLAPCKFGVTPHGVSYKLTNRRLVELRNEIHWGGDGWIPLRFVFGAETRSVQLDRFDNIDVHVQPGQAWFHAGDLVFRQGEVETFRLPGVSRPESFRACCMKARNSYVGVKQAMERQAVAT